MDDVKMSATNSTSRLLQLLMVLAVFAGGIVTYLILNKEEYFPAQYATHEHHSEEHKESNAHATAKKQNASEAPSTESSNVAAPVITKATSSANPVGRYSLVVGSFRSEENARNLLQQLQKEQTMVTPEIVQITGNEYTYYRIIATRSNSYKALQATRASLIENGYSDCWISE